MSDFEDEEGVDEPVLDADEDEEEEFEEEVKSRIMFVNRIPQFVKHPTTSRQVNTQQTVFLY